MVAVTQEGSASGTRRNPPFAVAAHMPSASVAVSRCHRHRLNGAWIRGLTGRDAITRSFIIAAASAAVLTLSATAYAQQADRGTADEAKAMLMKAVAALKVDKQKTLDLINDGEGGGFFDRDLYVFCANASDGKAVALGNPNASQLLGVDTRTLKDVDGKPFGQELYDAYQKPEGQITQVSYMFVRPGPDKTPVPKVSFATRVGDLGCGVGYYIRLQTQTP